LAGKIKSMIDTIIEKRAGGNPTIISTTKTKLLIKGINVENYNTGSDDDPAVIQKLSDIAKELGINL
jgi:hypothetical protein